MKIIIKILIKLNDFILKLIDYLSIKINKGIHPKHELTKYYDFFINNIKSGDSVLDIGCGIGFVSDKLAQKAKNVTGVDIEEKNLSIAKNKFVKENLRFILADATQYDFKEKFDVVILSNVLEHIKNRIEFLEKIKNLSNKFLIRVPMINRDWMTLYKKELGLWYFNDPTHYTEYTLDSFKQEISSANLSVESCSIQFGEIWAIIK
jgi:2-polyprenyl-3-methyl-5-hydroxy-6-metoxy-1,4-benzoquinol methylase